MKFDVYTLLGEYIDSFEGEYGSNNQGKYISAPIDDCDFVEHGNLITDDNGNKGYVYLTETSQTTQRFYLKEKY